MNPNSSIADKENCLPRNRSISIRKSLGSQRQSLNTSGFLNDKEEINGLNNKFTDYIDYVRSVEATNEKLKNEMQSIVDKSEREINEIRSTYGNEINSLRKALDDVTTAKATLTFDNKSLVEEKDKLTTKLRNESNSVIVLKKEISELEENLNNYRKKVDNYEDLRKEHSELIKEHNNDLKELKAVRCKHAELESRFVTLNEEVDFYKKVNASAKNSFDTKLVSVANVSVDRSAMQDEEVVATKMELTNTFEQYQEMLAKMYEENIEDLMKINDKSSLKCNSLYNEIKAMKRTMEELRNEIYEKDNVIASLNKRVAGYTDLLNKVNIDHENYIRDITEDNVNLKKDLESKIIELASIINEKISIEKELYTFRSLLDGEQSRCNISDVLSPKKRRQTCKDDYFDISAWSNARVKLLCDDQYDGSYILLMNDCESDVNVNEWKITMTTDDSSEIYCFPDRVVRSGALVKCWSHSRAQDVVEDDENVLMNVPLLVADAISCKITNDMDEMEASFELRKCYGKRRILKAKTKQSDKEGCSIM